MIAQAREALRRKPLIGVVASVAIHAALLVALLWVHPARTSTQKRGDALIVELPSSPESGRGTPGPQADAPPTPDPPAPAPKAPPTRPPALARPRPPAPAQRPAAERPTPKAEPRESPRAVASAPQPPPAAESGDMPAAKSAPQAPAEAPVPPAPPAVASTPPSPPGPVAMIPPGPVDSRVALRRGGGGGGIGPGGAGGTSTGRGGIEGEPIPLNSADPDFSDYLERVRALIKRHWVSPCVKDPQTHICEYKSGFLTIEFGILRSGQLAFVELHRSSGYVVLDDSASNAIKLASPFPAIPPALLKGRKGPGVPILARFHYVLETDFRSIIR